MSNGGKKARDKFSGFCQIDYKKTFEVTTYDAEMAAEVAMEFLLNPKWASHILDEITSLMIIVSRKNDEPLGTEQVCSLAQRLNNGNYALNLIPDFETVLEMPQEFAESKVFKCGYGQDKTKLKCFKVIGKITFHNTFEVVAKMPQMVALNVAKEIAKKKHLYFPYGNAKTFSLRAFDENAADRNSDCYLNGELVQEGMYKLMCDFEGEEHIGSITIPSRKRR